MLDWVFNGLLFEVFNFHIVHLILDVDPIFGTILQWAEYFEMCHFVHEWLV